MNYKLIGQLAPRIILWIGVVVFFGLALWLFYADKTASGSASAGVGAVILFMANLDRIETFKGFGLEAKTRDLRQAIAEAESTMAKLESMADQIKKQSDSIVAIQDMLDETKTLAQQAHAFAVIGL